MYYSALNFHFGEQYRHPSVTVVQTFLFSLAHSATSFWKCWLWLVFLTKAMLSRTSVEGEENWNSDEPYPVKSGCAFPIVMWENTKLGWILSYILIASGNEKNDVLITVYKTMSLFGQPFSLDISVLSLAELTMLLEMSPMWPWGRKRSGSWRCIKNRQLQECK